MADWILPAIQGAAAVTSAIPWQGNHSLSAQRDIQLGMNKEMAQVNFNYGEQGAINAIKRAEENYKKYQSPEALRRQYEEAGLNPALMYSGTGGGTGGGLNVEGSGDAGNQQAGNVSQMVMAEQQQKMMNIQKALTISEIGKNLTTAGMDIAGVKRTMYDLGLDTETREIEIEKRKAEMRKTEGESWTAKAESHIKELERQLANYKSTGEIGSKTDVGYGSHEKSNWETNEIIKGIEYILIDNQIKQSNYDTKIRGHDVNIRAMQETQENINTEIVKQNAKKLSNLMIEYQKQQISEKEFQTKMLEWLYNNKNFFKTIEVLSEIGKTVSGFIK
jgi:hypothetical protein